jgi:hypothetical protein
MHHVILHKLHFTAAIALKDIAPFVQAPATCSCSSRALVERKHVLWEVVHGSQASVHARCEARGPTHQGDRRPGGLRAAGGGGVHEQGARGEGVMGLVGEWDRGMLSLSGFLL